jgi:CelD/BcsL family acetyltransferase involved in cellulose biosynthesis
MKGLSRKLRKNLNFYLRRLRQSFSVEFKNYRDMGFSADEAMKLFLKLHEMRWKEKSVLKETSVKDFHLSVAKCFSDNGWLGLYFLTLNDEPVSAIYGFEYEQKLYYYLAGFDSRYSSYSIGNVLIRFLVEECIKKGFKEFDFMRGEETYKNHWTNTYRRNLEVKLIRTTPFNMFYKATDRVNRIIKVKTNLQGVT